MLQVTLQKAYKAHKYYQEHGKPLPAHIHEDDELRFLRGRTSVIKGDEPLVPASSPESSDMGMEPPPAFPTEPIRTTTSAPNYPVSLSLYSELINLPLARHARAPLSSAFRTLQYQTFTDLSNRLFHHSTGADHATVHALSSLQGGATASAAGTFPRTNHANDYQSQTVRWQGHIS